MPVGISKIQIFRMALSHVGSKSNVESPDENTPAAYECRLWYDVALEKTLEAYDWAFARKAQALTVHSEDAPEVRWAFRYQYPSDCVAPRLIENPLGSTENAVPYRVENAGDETLSILTNTEDATLIYTYRVTTPALWSMSFVNAMAVALGGLVAYKLTGKQSKVTALEKSFATAILNAQLADVNSSIPPDEREAETIRVRS